MNTNLLRDSNVTLKLHTIPKKRFENIIKNHIAFKHTDSTWHSEFDVFVVNYETIILRTIHLLHFTRTTNDAKHK